MTIAANDSGCVLRAAHGCGFLVCRIEVQSIVLGFPLFLLTLAVSLLIVSLSGLCRSAHFWTPVWKEKGVGGRTGPGSGKLWPSERGSGTCTPQCSLQIRGWTKAGWTVITQQTALRVNGGTDTAPLAAVLQAATYCKQGGEEVEWTHADQSCPLHMPPLPLHKHKHSASRTSTAVHRLQPAQTAGEMLLFCIILAFNAVHWKWKLDFRMS